VNDSKDEQLLATVDFDLPIRLRLEDGSFIVQYDDTTASIELTERRQATFDERLGISAAENVELLRDRHGLLSYSHVSVRCTAETIVREEYIARRERGEYNEPLGIINLNLTKEILANEFAQPALSTAVNITNRLISLYRWHSNDYFVRTIQDSEVFRAHVLWSTGPETILGVELSRLGQGLGLRAPNLNASTTETIRQMLADDVQVHDSLDLLSDAKDYLDRGQYRLGVIDARTALEVQLDLLLKSHFERHQTSIPEMIQILDSKKDATSVDEVLEYAKIDRKLKHGLREIFGLDLPAVNGRLWQNWQACKEIRDRGTHAGNRVGKNDAKDAVNTIVAIMSVIREAMLATDEVG
jgi:hypothetical protein